MRIQKVVSIEDLRGKNVSEQFQLLEDSGYQRQMENPYCTTFFGEWNQILDADEDGYITECNPDLLSTEKTTVPFVLKAENGTVIDEYNYVCFYYWDTDPARQIAVCWIRGGEQETVLTMPTIREATSNGMFLVYGDPAAYTLTAHDVKCYEERVAFHFSGMVKVASLLNGRFVLATNVGINGNCWSGFPVCGDGDEDQYRKNILRHLSIGVGIDGFYEAGHDDSMTFPTREEALAWADRVGIEIVTETE